MFGQVRGHDRLVATLLAGMLLGAAAQAAAGEPTLTPRVFVPGDVEVGSSVEVQDLARVAAGAGGSLVVWEDQRPVLSGFSDMAYEPLTGNQRDIYAARLDADGQLVWPEPIVISQAARNQSTPQVAWNESAQAWLVVWVSERPQWYFARDIVAARVAADGALLDPSPIVLRPENASPANDYAQNPTVASDGQVWLVAWEDTQWIGDQGRPNLAGKRVDAGGAVLDPEPVVLYPYGLTSFGPILPHLAWAQDEYLLVWERSGYYDLYGRRIASDLQPLGAEFVITTHGHGPRVATDGEDFLVVSRSHLAHRVTHAGASLDPLGIDLQLPGGPTTFRGPDVAWDGAHWCVVGTGGPFPQPLATYLTRLAPDGTVVTGGVAIAPGPDDQLLPAIASAGDGGVQVVWSQRNLGVGRREDIHGARLDADGAAGPNTLISAGLARQSHVRFATSAGEHLAVFLSQGGGESRILAQRLDASGNALDVEPTLVAIAPETKAIHPDVAWTGGEYVVAWVLDGTVWARRLAPSGTPLGPPVALIADAALSVGAGALGGDVLFAYTHVFSGDQVSLRAIKAAGGDLDVAGPPVTIGPSFVDPFPRVGALGDRWFVAWAKRPTHDSPASTPHGAFVTGAGALTPPFSLGDAGYGFEVALAAGDGRALVAWTDDGDYLDPGVEARLVGADGSFATEVLTICDEVGPQRFPACGWDGARFTVAWTDYRSLGEVDQLRGDIYLGRLAPDGVPLDPAGVPVTSGELPEDLPALAGSGGATVVAFSELTGATARYVQRVGYRVLGAELTRVDDAGVPAAALRMGPNPFRSELAIELDVAKGDDAAPWRLEVFDVAGRRLVEAAAPAGAARLAWDGRDGRGRAVPGGVYLVRVSSGGRLVASRKVTRAD